VFNAFIKPLTISDSATFSLDWILLNENDFNKFIILSELLENENFSDQIFFSKSLSYFLNRYIKHPQKLYQVWFLKKEGKIIGIIVTKQFKADDVRVHIIDYILSSNEYLSEMLDDFELKFSKHASLSVLWPNSKYFSDLLIHKGYKQTGFDTFFGIKILSQKALDNQDLLLDFNKWRLCMGDSDAF